MNKIKLNINQQKQNYSVIIGSNIISKFSKLLKNCNFKSSKYFLVIDKNIPKTMIKKLINSLNRKNVTIYYFKATEKNKVQKSVDLILDLMLKKNFSRNDQLQ